MNAAAFDKNGIKQIYVPVVGGRPVQRSTGSNSPKMAARMKDMVTALKRDREWDLLAAVTSGRLSLGQLYDAYVTRALDTLRLRLRAVDLEPLVDSWIAAKRAERGDTGTFDHYLAQVRTLIPEGQPFGSADLTVPRIQTWLTGLTVSTGTRRHYYAALSSFIEFCVSMGALEASPLVRGRIKRPKKNAARERWILEADAIRLVERAEGIYKPLEALIQGTGAEIGGVLTWSRNPVGILRRDINLEAGTAYIRGTKAVSRARFAIIRPWAIPFIRDYVSGMLPNAHPFAGVTRYMAYHFHLAACKAAGLSDYTLHDARHTWAVNARLRGISLEDIAEQLGHKGIASTMLYAKYKPTMEQRQQAEAK